MMLYSPHSGESIHRFRGQDVFNIFIMDIPWIISWIYGWKFCFMEPHCVDIIPDCRPACGNIASLTVKSKSINAQHLHGSFYQPNVKFNYSYLSSIIFNLSTMLRMQNFQVKCRPCLKSRGQGRLV